MASPVESAIRGLQSLVIRVRKGVTFGVRGLVTRDGAVFLVRHTYVPGWYLPGGGVEPFETSAASLARELAEEGNMTAREPFRLLGLYFNPQIAGRDHVAVYHVTDFDQDELPRPNAEIAEVGWFAMDALPPAMNPGSERRIREFLGQAAPTDRW